MANGEAPDVKEFPQPTRLTGDPVIDLAALHEYVWALFRVVFLERGGLVQNDDIGGLAGVDSVATDDIQNKAVTLAKLQDIATRTLLGRTSSGTGAVELVSFTLAGLALLQAANNAAQRAALGLGTLATKSSIDTTDINDNVVTHAKYQNIDTDRLLGRTSGGTGDPEEIALSPGARSFILDEIPTLKSYTVATVPSAATYARGLIYVSDEAGGAVPAFSDGAAWRRVTDRAVVS